MSDLIDRQKAIDALGKRPEVLSEWNLYSIGAQNQYDADVLHIELLPSEDTERKTGKWTSDATGVLRCSECNTQAPWRFKGIMYDSVDFRWKANYCPNCGARMDTE